MKILFFSDIHGINHNLNTIKKVISNNNFDKIVVLGDLYYQGPNYDNSYEINSKAVKDFLMTYQDKLITLKGNCDSDVDIKSSDFPICNNLALIHTDGIDIYCTHGNEYSLEKSNKFNRKGVLVYGHEHIPYIKQNNDMVYICVGSLSLPKQNSSATYMIYEHNNFILYNIDGTENTSIEIK